MLNTPQAIFDAFTQKYSEEIISVFQGKMYQTQLLLDGLLDITQQLEEKIASEKELHFLNFYKNYINKLITINEEHFTTPEPGQAQKTYAPLYKAQEILLQEIADEVTLDQDESSFLRQEDDNILAATRKGIKRASRKTQGIFTKRGNVVVWKRKVPLRNYSILHFVIKPEKEFWDNAILLFDLEKQILTKAKNRTTELAEISKEKSINKDKILATIHTLKTEIEEESRTLADFEGMMKKNILNTLTKCQESFLHDFSKLGTRDYKRKNIKARKLRLKLKHIKEGQNQAYFKQEKSVFAHAENWGLALDLVNIKTQSQTAFLKLNESKAFGLKAKVIERLNHIESKLQEAIVSLIDNETDNALFNDLQTQYRKAFDLALGDDELKVSYDEESKYDFCQTLEKRQKDIEQELDGIKDSRLINKPTENDAQEKHDFITIRPKELIKFETLTRCNTSLNEIKTAFSTSIQEYELSIIDLTHFIDYNFDTAQTILKHKDGGLEAAKLQNKEGLNLAIEKTQIAKNNIDEIFTTALQKTEESLSDFGNELLSLTINKNIGELRIRLIRAKAINDSKILRNKGLEWYNTAIEYLKKHSTWILLKSNNVGQQLSKLYLQKGTEGRVNAELANFLLETKNTIESLPFIYQRLFKLSPISNGYLFFLRRKELSIMRKAYHNWTLQRYSSMAIIGEKGAGVTSHVQHFLHDITEAQLTINFKEQNGLYQPDEFIAYLAKALEQPLNSTKDELIEHLNARERTVIFTEGLHYLYLKQLEGFECLKVYFDIIAKTMQNILWITSCTKHAWNYLDKVMNIKEYYSYVIRLGEFSSEEMIDIVSKRHKVSGNDLVFAPSKNDISNKRYSKLNMEAQQQYLEKQFFSQLNKLSAGNISVALMFWLRSTDGIKNNTLTLKSLQNFDGSFIKDLSKEKLFALHAILLHDGLTTEDFCRVMRKNCETGKIMLTQMENNGLLIKTKERYVINFLLYRTTINALKDQNILH